LYFQFRFQSFRARILTFFLGLLIIVLVAIFLSVNTVSVKSARLQIDDALEVTSGVFKRLITERNQRLLEAARLLSSDFAFKSAYATHDRNTILSALDNHRTRIQADTMMLVSIDNIVLADTLHPDVAAVPFLFPELVKAAESNEYGEAASVVFIDGRAYQMVVVPLLIPAPDAWICIGFLIDDIFAMNLQRLTQSHVSLLKAEEGGGWSIFASTLPDDLRIKLPQILQRKIWNVNESMPLVINDIEYISLATSLFEGEDLRAIAVLQRSLPEALRPYMRLRLALAGLFAVGLILSVVGGILIARTVTKPVLTLAEGMHRIDEGDYTRFVAIEQEDEIGRLSNTFNKMVKGLAERDRVRNLLGKVVSVAVAEELLSKEIDLGGEEREVTVIFSDLRNFTALCEDRSPKDILSLLNAYLTKVSAVVEANGGVVDKYIGDALMAIYGAPLRHDDDAERAVNTAIQMHQSLAELNSDFLKRGLPRLDMGIGINTALVVAGNMGSQTRLNYTVIGDGVNLASRLEGLSKKYGVSIIVSESTRAMSPSFVFRELDRVIVKGKTAPIVIYQPIGKIGGISQPMLDELNAYNEGLKFYRNRQWDMAMSRFLELKGRDTDCYLYQFYINLITDFLLNPPDMEWDGTSVFYEK
jgi:adenylate cyclase